MLDQAQQLRTLMAQRGAAPVPPAAPAGRRTRVIAVTSGKGGVGKTNLVVNLGVAWAQRGRRVVVLDGDLGLANVDVLLGLQTRHTLAHVLRGERRLDEVVQIGPCGLGIIPGASGLAELADLTDERRDHLVAELARLDGWADAVLVDTGAGIGAGVSALLLAAGEVVVVTTPEPTALTDAYALVKVATAAGCRAHLRLVVNQARSAREAQMATQRLVAVAQEFLGVSLEAAGFLPYDDCLPQAVKRQVPVVLAYPQSALAGRLIALSQRLWQNRWHEAPSLHDFLQRLALAEG
ncbi:MAG: MinD/ParA family protein [Chloroflexi bacterium]|nr:MinD/ParA family protein [Chloroflexota bacterium]MBI4507793.1 MinD/ParA family protein [Chloroflexota bacterium]